MINGGGHGIGGERRSRRGRVVGEESYLQITLVSRVAAQMNLLALTPFL